MLIISLAFVVLVIFFCFVLYQLFKLLSDVQLIVNDTSIKVNGLIEEVNETVTEVNVLLDDINEKVQKIDPLFVAVGEVSVTISDINSSSRKFFDKTKRIVPKRKSTSILGLIGIELAKNFFFKK